MTLDDYLATAYVMALPFIGLAVVFSPAYLTILAWLARLVAALGLGAP